VCPIVLWRLNKVATDVWKSADNRARRDWCFRVFQGN